METTTAGTVCSRTIFSFEPEALVTQALATMSANRISCVLVVLEKTPVGIVTERDLVRCASKVLNFPDLQLRDIMTSPLLTVACDTPILDAYRLLRENQVRHLVVLDDSYDIAGILTQTDILFKLSQSHFSDIDRLADVMTREVVQVTPEQGTNSVLAEMARQAISCVVVTENHRPVGMFTERDVTRLMTAPAALRAGAISQLMTPPQPPVSSETSSSRAIELMREQGIRRLVVADRNGQVEGIVTQSDLGRLLDSKVGTTSAGSTCDPCN